MMSVCSSLESSGASNALLPPHQASEPTQTLPENIDVIVNESMLDPEDDAAEDEVTESDDDSEVVMKDNYPKVLIAVGARQKIGESIFTLILKHACITGYEGSFKHGKKKKYLDTLHASSFKDDDIFNK